MREENRAADALANVGVRMQLGYHELDCAPTNVFDISMQDIIGVSFSRLCNWVWVYLRFQSKKRKKGMLY